jgi:hypothetical protein
MGHHPAIDNQVGTWSNAGTGLGLVIHEIGCSKVVLVKHKKRRMVRNTVPSSVGGWI